jgi:hypothetical protein
MRRDSGPRLTLSASRARAPGGPGEGGRSRRVGWVTSPTLRNGAGVFPTSERPRREAHIPHRKSAHAA